jgi:hypothetical protein
MMMEAEPMRVLQLAKRSVLAAAAVCVALTGCGDSGPEVPFNPAGTTADLAAMNATFESSTFASFSTFSLLFDAALGPSPLITASQAALDIRAGNKAGMRVAAMRSAKRMAALMSPKPSGSPRPGGGFSASAAAIPPEAAGKTFIYDLGTGGYVVSDREPLASHTVRFILYAVDPVTFAPVDPLVETGYVDLIDVSYGSTSAARVRVFSGDTEYLDYLVSVSSTATSGWISVVGFVTDGATQANVHLQSTLTSSAGLTLTYSVDVPSRDVSIDLTLASSGFDPETSTIEVTLDMRGPNGWLVLSGEFTVDGGTLTVRSNGNLFATITSTGTADPVITGAGGEPLAGDEAEALQGIFLLTGEAFTSFDQMFAPVGAILEPAA